MKVVVQMNAALVLVCLLTVAVHAQNAPRLQPVDLGMVLERAETYVSEYEQQLGMIIGEENYVQNATWMTRGFPNSVAQRQQRRLRSDFLLLPILEQWYGVRNVLRVDGLPVEAPATFPESPEEIIANRTDAQHNIGEFARTFNVPTFALTLLRPDNINRFSFEKRDEDRIDDVNTWEIEFSETVSPTVVRGSNGDDRFATGRFWISPESGEVLRTELVFDVDSDEGRYEARIRVQYEANALLGLLVPDTMDEHYDSRFHSVDARADYSNFKRFSVRVEHNPGAVVQ